MEKLIKSKLQDGSLLLINDKFLIQRYNNALKALIAKETKLSEFNIDATGYSPEIAKELNDTDYLNINKTNKKIIIISTKQSQLPVIDAHFSNVKYAVKTFINENYEKIFALLGKDVIFGEIEDFIFKINNVNDLLKITKVHIQVDTYNKIIENSKDIIKMKEQLLGKNDLWNNNEFLHTLVNKANIAGNIDVENIMSNDIIYENIDYYTSLLNGVYIFDNLKKNKRIVYLKNREGIEIGVEENDSISILDMDRVKDTKTFNRMFYLDVDKEKLQFKINYILDVLLINYFGNIDINILELSEHKKNILIDTHFDDLAKSYHELSNLYMAIENNLNLKEEINNLSNETILSLVTVRTDSNIPYDLSMHFLSNFYKENFVRMYAFNKELFYKEYETWNSTKQEMVINFLLNNYVPVRKQIKYRL
jgi:hypothetical protein